MGLYADGTESQPNMSAAAISLKKPGIRAWGAVSALKTKANPSNEWHHSSVYRGNVALGIGYLQHIASAG